MGQLVVAVVKRNVSVTEDKREKLRLLLLMNNKNPEKYPSLFVSFDDVVGELLRVYEMTKGEIRDPGIVLNRAGRPPKITIVGAEGIL